MSLPYENSTAKSEGALNEIRKVLTAFGCTKFGTMQDTVKEEVLLQFEYRNRQVSVKASAKGYAAAWLKAHPWKRGKRVTNQQREERALRQARVAVYSILRDWIKGQITAVECGILSFEGAFLGQILLPTGKTVLQTAEEQHLLPAPEQKVITLGAKA